jgi:hypothetical protein
MTWPCSPPTPPILPLLRAVITQHQQVIRLGAGQRLLVSNTRWLHGRDRYTGPVSCSVSWATPSPEPASSLDSRSRAQHAHSAGSVISAPVAAACAQGATGAARPAQLHRYISPRRSPPLLPLGPLPTLAVEGHLKDGTPAVHLSRTFRVPVRRAGGGPKALITSASAETTAPASACEP